MCCWSTNCTYLDAFVSLSFIYKHTLTYAQHCVIILYNFHFHSSMTFLSHLPWNKPSVLPWIVLFFAALNVIFLGGKRRAFGSFVAVFNKSYPNISLTELNWIGDSYSALGYMSTGLSIKIILYFKRRFGLFQFIGSIWVLISCITSSFVPNPHWLFLTHTLFHGIGSSLIISVAGLVVSEFFDKKNRYHILATTLVSGGSVASILFVTLFSELIQTYGWRESFIILGIVYFIVTGSAAIFYRRNEDLPQESENKAKSCQCKTNISCKQWFLLLLWFIDRVMTSVVTYGLLMNLTIYLYRLHKNLTHSSALTMLFASGEAVTYLIGAIITAITKDFFKEKLRYILFTTALSMSFCLLMLEFFNKHIVVTYILCFFSGFSLGPSITFLFPAGEELTRLPGTAAYPFSLGGMGFGMLVSPLLSAKIAETFKYHWFFFVQGCLIFIKVICLFLIIVILHFHQSQIDTDSEKKEEDSSTSETEPILGDKR